MISSNANADNQFDILSNALMDLVLIVSVYGECEQVLFQVVA